MKILMLAALLLRLLPQAAPAEPAVPYPPETILHTKPTSGPVMRVLEAVYPGVMRCQPDIRLPLNARGADVQEALQLLCRDYPEAFHLSGEFQLHYRLDAPDVVASVSPTYIADAQTCEARQAQLLQLVEQAVAQTTGSEADRAEQLHDWLCQRVSYVTEGDSAHTAWGALMDGRATCTGYTSAYMLLLRTAGLPCGLVGGTAHSGGGEPARHCWNVARIDGRHTLIDVTWNDCDQQGVITHWYYGLTDAQMAADHLVDAGSVVPPCTDASLNWHVRRGRIVTDSDLFDAAMQQLVRTGEPVNLRWAEAERFDAFLSGLNDALLRYNAAFPQEAFIGVYDVLHNVAQHCLILRRR